MGTKQNPGEYDCYEKAEPDEPMFILLARDPVAPVLVRLWCQLRQLFGKDVDAKFVDAIQCASDMETWLRRRRTARDQDEQKHERDSADFDSQLWRLDDPVKSGEDIEKYLDGCIRRWRNIRDSDGEGMTDAARTMAVYYIDAFQSVRTSLFGQVLPPGE